MYYLLADKNMKHIYSVMNTELREMVLSTDLPQMSK